MKWIVFIEIPVNVHQCEECLSYLWISIGKYSNYNKLPIFKHCPKGGGKNSGLRLYRQIISPFFRRVFCRIFFILPPQPHFLWPKLVLSFSLIHKLLKFYVYEVSSILDTFQAPMKSFVSWWSQNYSKVPWTYQTPVINFICCQ